MRNVTAYLLLLPLLQACQQKPAETTKQPAAAIETPVASVLASAKGALAQQFSPIISGSWVSTDYLQEVARTRSPAAAFDYAPAPASLAISSFTTQADSVEIGASYGMHEGGNLTILLQPGKRSNALPIRRDYSDSVGTFREVSYRIGPHDTTLFISSYSRKTDQLIYQQAYRRTGGIATTADLETGVKRGINQLLLARQYRGVDSLGHAVQAQFLLDGTVRGLPFRKYFVQTDFTEPNPGDAIVFDVYTKQQCEFAAVYGRDTLRLYIIRSVVGVPAGTSDTTTIFSRGRLCYQLVRTPKP